MRIFKYHSTMRNRPQYQQLECLECLKLTNKMLVDETALLVANRFKSMKKCHAPAV